MNRVSRRAFIRYATAGTAAATVLPGMTALSADKVAGANERVRVAMIGVGLKGAQHTDVFRRLKNAEIVAICDADKARAAGVAAKLNKDGGSVPCFQDMRKVLEDDSIDAIVATTPNHWHALGTIWALQAGKHVYVEKPVCHNIFEGRMMVKAAEKYGTIVQAGFQNRSDVGLLQFFPWLHEGNLGKIEMLYGQCFRNRFSIGKRRAMPMDPAKAAKDVDYDLWLGPADDIPIHRPKFHYDWHWSWNTGNGDMGNQGPHELDLIQWARGDGALPKRVISFGERFGWNDAGETPNIQLGIFDYGDYPCYFEVRDLCANPTAKYVVPNHKLRVGIYIKCEKGFFRGGRGGGKAYDNDGKVIRHFKGDGGGRHQQNFIDAIRENKPEMVHAKLADAVKSSDLSHMANTALRVGNKATGEEVKAYLKDDDKALETLGLVEDYLKGWKIDTRKEKYLLGKALEFDLGKEQFTGGEKMEEANLLLTRDYRKTYVVREKV